LPPRGESGFDAINPSCSLLGAIERVFDAIRLAADASAWVRFLSAERAAMGVRALLYAGGCALLSGSSVRRCLKLKGDLSLRRDAIECLTFRSAVAVAYGIVMRRGLLEDHTACGLLYVFTCIRA